MRHVSAQLSLMCGISGVVVSPGEHAQPIIDRQLEVLKHRGPDAEGWFGSDEMVVAQNRLSIIDLVAGDPPIQNEDGKIGAVLNGEIYNFRELRSELGNRGHVLTSKGDTEVLVHLAEDHDPVALAQRLDGMFSFAISDRRRDRLILGRDRLGKKPLYYWHGEGRFVFASEIKGVLADPAVPRRLNDRAIPPYLALGYVPTPDTFYESIKSVPPGHVLVLETNGKLWVTSYWHPRVPGASDLQPHRGGFKQATTEVRAALERAVERRLVSDVPLGAFLSGGIDSSIIVALMTQLDDKPVETFTIGFEDNQGFDERPYARLIARRFRTKHHEFVVQPDAVELLETLLWHHDQPFGDSSAVPTYLLSKLTRDHVTVALAGDGGDELFAGYERFAAAVASGRLGFLPRPLRETTLGAVGAVVPRVMRKRGERARRFLDVAASGLPQSLHAWVSFINETDRRALLNRQEDGGTSHFEEQWRASQGAALLDRILDLNLRTYLLDDLLVKTDRMSMAHGLEVRSPLLDIDLLDLTASLPPRFKLRGLTFKRILKAATADLLPTEIQNRRKRGFGVPLDRWFREDLRTYVMSTLGARDARVGTHLRADQVSRLLVEHSQGQRNHGHALWTLLTLEAFLRREGW